MQNLWFDTVTGTYGDLGDLVVVSLPDRIASNVDDMGDDGERMAYALGQCVMPCKATFGPKLETLDIFHIVGGDFDTYIEAVSSRNEDETESGFDN